MRGTTVAVRIDTKTVSFGHSIRPALIKTPDYQARGFLGHEGANRFGGMPEGQGQELARILPLGAHSKLKDS